MDKSHMVGIARWALIVILLLAACGAPTWKQTPGMRATRYADYAARAPTSTTPPSLPQTLTPQMTVLSPTAHPSATGTPTLVDSAIPLQHRSTGHCSWIGFRIAIR